MAVEQLANGLGFVFEAVWFPKDGERLQIQAVASGPSGAVSKDGARDLVGNAESAPRRLTAVGAKFAAMASRATQWWNEGRVGPTSTRRTLRRDDASAVGDSLTMADALRQQLEALERTLAHHGQHHAAQVIRRALAGAEPDLRTFLVSNELWGAAGSIADQAGIDQTGIDQRRESRRAIEAALIALGLEQMRQGLVNVRTEMWVEAFSKWQREGI